MYPAQNYFCIRTLNVRKFYISESLNRAAVELWMHKFDLVGMELVKSYSFGTATTYNFRVFRE
jgi:hypothetical protein